jgi:hypothetical protein
MDYGKVSTILKELYENRDVLVEIEYLPEEYFIDYQDVFALSRYVSAQWAEPTQVGKEMLDAGWGFLCLVRELDPTIMYDSTSDFWLAQGVDFS